MSGKKAKKNREAARMIERWILDPVAFVRDNFQVEPDAWQLEVLKAFNHNPRLAMKACKGPGKTTVLAWLCWYFLSTRTHPKIAATSITSDNLGDGLWAEMAKWQGRLVDNKPTSPFLKEKFTWTKTRIFYKEHPETWWMSARTWPKSGDTSKQSDTLAGLHADNIMFVLDEAGGIPDAVMAAAEAALANDMGQFGYDAKIVIAGNPTHLEGPLYRACTVERDLWWLIEITSDPDDPMRTPRVSMKWANDQIKKYGRDNPWVLINVFGKFPPASINSLIGPDEVHAAMRRSLKLDAYSWQQKRLGIDVARFGDDRTVIFPRQGKASFRPVELRNMNTVDIGNRVLRAKMEWGSEMEFVDDTGHWGHGVIDTMSVAGASPIGIQFHGSPIDPRYKNKRAEMWVEMTEWIRKGGCLPNIPELVGELTTPTYTFVGGKLVLEDKDLVKERLGRSPDLADALALTFAMPDMPGSTKNDAILHKVNQMRRAHGVAEVGHGGTAADYNPFKSL